MRNLYRKYILFALLSGFLLFSVHSIAQVNFTGGVVPHVCVSDAAYVTVPDIIITETNPTDFVIDGMNRTFRLGFTTASRFQFNPLATPTISFTGNGALTVSATPINLNATQLTIQITESSDANSSGAPNALRISGLQVRAVNLSAASSIQFDRDIGIAPTLTINGFAVNAIVTSSSLNSDGLPSTANAGTDQTGASGVCTSSTTLNAAAPSVGTGQWNFISNPSSSGVIADLNNRNSSLSGTPGTTYELQWSVTNGVCAPSTDNVLVHFDQVSAPANAGTDQNICGTYTTLNADAPTIGTGQWSFVSNPDGLGAIGNVNNRQSPFSGAAGSIYTLAWTITNGGCSPRTDNVIIHFYQSPTASSAGSNLENCNSGNFSLAANSPTVGTGLWSVVAGSATITTPSSSTSNVTGVPVGSSALLRWTISNGTCTPSTSDVRLTNYAPSSPAVAGPDIVHCNNSTFIMNATPPAVGSGVWAVLSGGGTATLVDLTSPTTTVIDVTDTVTLRWIVSNGICLPNTDDIVLINNPLPTTSIAGTNQNQCNNGNFTLAANTPSEGTAAWSIIGPANGAVITNSTSPTSTITGLNPGFSVTLRWTISNAPCSPSSSDVILTNYAPVTVDAGSNSEVCEGTNFNFNSQSTPASASNYASISWSHTGTGTLFNSTSFTPIYQPDIGETGTITFTLTANGGCGLVTDQMILTINPLPTPVISGLNSVCEGVIGVSYSTPAAAGHSFSWVITGGTITAGAGTNSIVVTWGSAGVGTLQLTESITTGITCSVTTALYNVTKNANPTPVISGTSPVCAGQSGEIYTTAFVSGHSYSWSVTGGTITSGAGSNSITVTWGSGSSGTVQVVQTNSTSGCSTTSAIYPVTINPLPTPVISGLNSVCEGVIGVSYSTPAAAGHSFSWVITGGTITAGAGTNSIVVTWGSAGVGTLQLTESITTGITCSVTTALYNVTKNANPTPVISGTSPVCAGQSGEIYTTAFVSGHSYSWSVTGGTITSGAGSNSITVTWGSGSSGTVQVVQTNSTSGCSTTSAIYPVTINPLPTPVISGLNSVCEGVIGVSYSTPAAAGHSFSWVITGGTITAGAGTNSIVVTWGSAGVGTLQLTESITTGITCSVTTALYNVTKNANPTPVISGTSPVCAGQSGEIYTTAFVSGHSYSWSVTGGTITSGAGSNSITVTWGSGSSGTVQVVQTNSTSGCSTTSAIYPVTINPLPTPVISGLNSVCEGVIGVSYSTPAAAGHSFSWVITGGTITAGAGTNSIVVTWGSAGVGTLQLTESITTGITCSVTTALYNVTKNANPTPVISGTSPVCAGQSGEIYTTAFVSGHSYSWSVTGGTITSGAGSNSITVTWGSGSSGTVQVVQTNSTSGCSTTSAIYPVTINPLPTPVISGLNSVCEGVIGVSYSTPAAAGHSFSWVITGGTITAGAGTNSIVVTWGSAGVGTLQLTESITTGITCSVTTALYNVTKNANPTPVISGTSPVCAGQSGEIYTTAFVSGHSYSWSVTGGTITSGAGSNSITVTWGSGSSGTVQVVQTNSTSGCSTTSAIYPVTINPLPTPVISGLNSVCEGVIGVSYSTPAAAGHSFSWVITGGTITAGAGTNSIVVTWGSAGVGTLQLTESITTGITCSVTTALYNVTKNANPTPVISGTSPVCAGQSGEIYTTAFVSGHSYSWSVTGGTITSGAGSNSITVTWGSGSSGTVQVVQTNSTSGCSTTSAIYPVTINPLPTPVISGLNSVCEGVIGVSYSTPAAAGHSFSWVITGGTITAGAGTNSIVVTWGSAGVGTLQLTESITTGITCSVTTALYNVTKNANPTPVISGTSPVCAGQSGEIYTTAFVSGHSYSWSVTGGTITSGAGSNSITVTWGSGSSGTVQVVQTNSTSGCSTTSAIYPVTINPLPTPVISGLNSVCEGVIGVSYSTPAAAGHSFSWVITGGTITAGAGTNSIVVTWGSAGVGTLQLTESITTGITCSVTTALYNVTKNANPTPVISGTSPVCAGQSGEIYTTAFVSGHSYSWSVTGGTITSGAGSNSITVTWGSGSSGTVQVVQTNSTSGCSTTSAIYPVTINPLPTPVISGLNSVCEGVIGVSYSTPAAAGHSFSWVITGGTITAGAGTNSIVVTWGSAGVGTLQLTESITTGITCSVTTALYNVTKNANPTPVISGTSPVCAGQSGEIYTTAFVSGHSYSWSVTGGTITSGAGSNSITVTWGSGSSGTVQVVQTNSTSGCSTTSAIYPVTINPNPIVTAIANQIACNAATVSPITLSANTGGGETFTWTGGASVGLSNGSDNTFPFTIPSFTAINTGTSPVTVTINVIATKAGCTGPVQSFTVTVNPSPTFLISNTTSTICEGTAASITLTSSTANAVITLMSAVYGGATGGSYIGGEIFTSGQKINETLGNPIDNPVTATYIFSVAANGCSNSTTQQTTVTVNPAPPVFSIVNSTSSICTATATNIQLNTPTLNAQVRLDAVSYGNATGSALPIGSLYTNGQIITQTLTNITNAPTMVTYTFSVSANGCSNPVQQQTTVLVNPSPTMSISNTTTSICSGTAIGITLNSVTSGAIIRLTNVSYGGVSGTLTWPQNYTPGSVITESLTNPTHNPITVTYSFDVSANGCYTAGPFTTSVIVKPSPVFSITNITPQVCEGTATDITLNTPTAGGTIKLDHVNYNGATGTLVDNQTFTNGQKITEVLVNPTNSPITVTYIFSVSATGCSNPVQQQTTVSITRSPTVVVPADYTICEPVSIPLTGTIGASALSGLWSVISGGGTLSATNVSGTTVTANYTVDVADIGNTITLRLTSNDPDGPAGPCVPVFDDINIKINRAASITAGIDLTQCRDQSIIELQGAVTYAPNGVLWSGGTGIFSNSAAPDSKYSFNNPSEINTTVTLTLTANDPDGAGPTGPCGIVTDQMTLKINQLPTVVFSGFGPGSPPQIAENATPVTLTGNKSGGTFTISPTTSFIGSTSHLPVDKVSFDPSVVELGSNFVTYTFTDENSCTNSETQQIIVNPVTDIDFTLQYWSGPLAGQFVPPNGTGGFDFCGQIGDVRIVGNPVASSGISPTNFVAVGANAAVLNARISQVGADYFINTNGLPSDDYLLQYTYTNSLGVTSAPLTRPLKVFASPVAVIDNLTNNCISSAIVFKDASTLPTTPFPTTITSWRWDFGDGEFGSLKNQPHPYDASGVYNVQLTVTTASGQACTGSTSLSIRVGDVPLVDFDWSAICTNDNTKFQDETDPGSISTIDTYTWDFGDGDVITGPPSGAIPVGTHGGRTFGTYQNPEHNYVSPGSKNVVLSVETNDGCNNSKPKSIAILVSGSTVTPYETEPYINTFESADSEWISEGFEISTNPDVFSNQSWQFGIPTGAIINAANGATSAWWTGSNGNSYWPSEESAVNGPCFNLTSLSRPMVTLDYWSDAEQNLDGAALQYSTDGGLNWNIVGPLASSPNEGINWYNGQTVQSNPGRQPFGSNGWTGKLTGWKNARFNLDMIPKVERDQVRLRVAFSSNNTNDPSKTFDGFAFDNVFIGDRKRNVMVEYFTNAGVNPSLNTYFDNLYAAQFLGPLSKDSSDFFKIQYHIANPTSDPINQDNPKDPADRSLFYGISQDRPPFAIMDGILGDYYNTTFDGNHLLISEEQLERRALEDPLFDIRIDTLTSGPTSINFHVEFTYKHPTLAFSTPVMLQVALVEDNVGTPNQRNVLRKFLLGNAEGVSLTIPWTLNHTESIDRELQIDAPISKNNNNDLYLVAFIQDTRLNSKVIHQALKVRLKKKSRAVITGIPESPDFAEVQDLSIYPNPATRFINFATDNLLTRDYQWTIVDQRGITVLSGNLNRDLTIPQQVELSNIADGVYIVMIHQGNKRLIQRKLAVLKR